MRKETSRKLDSARKMLLEKEAEIDNLRKRRSQSPQAVEESLETSNIVAPAKMQAQRDALISGKDKKIAELVEHVAELEKREARLSDTISALRMSATGSPYGGEGSSSLHGYGNNSAHSVEYLKNMVLNYMVTTDAEPKQQILRVISTILKFSEDETEMARQHIADTEVGLAGRLFSWASSTPASSRKPLPMSSMKSAGGNFFRHQIRAADEDNGTLPQKTLKF